MTTSTRWLALPLAGLLLTVSGGHTQPPAPARTSPALPPPAGVAPAVPAPDIGPARPPAGYAVPVQPVGPERLAPLVVPATPPPAPEPSIDQLLDRLEKLRQQKDELDRQERAVTEQIRESLRKQRERLGRLGVEEAPPPRAAAVPATASY